MGILTQHFQVQTHTIDEKSVRFAAVAPMAGPAEARHTHLQRNRAASLGQEDQVEENRWQHSMMFHVSKHVKTQGTPIVSSHQNSWDLWIFIPLKMVLYHRYWSMSPYFHLMLHNQSFDVQSFLSIFQGTRFRQRAHASYRRSSCQLAKALTTSGRSAATSGSRLLEQALCQKPFKAVENDSYAWVYLTRSRCIRNIIQICT